MLYAFSNNIFSLKKEFRGMLSLPEGITLHKIASSLPQKSYAIEIGCYKGLSSSFILSGLNKSSKLISIDPFGKDLDKQLDNINKYSDKNYKKMEYDLMKIKNTKQIVENDLKKKGFKHFELIEAYSYEIAKKWKKKVDFLWIDGNHDYLAVKKDFNDWARFLKKGGVIAFHDSNNKSNSTYWNWGWRGPSKVVNENITSKKWINIGKIDSITFATKNY